MSSILFINPLTKNIEYSIFDTQKNTVEVGEVVWYDVSISLPQKISELSKKYTLSEIWCIEWPWAFTKMRITTLTLNTLRYTYKNSIFKWCHFFEILRHISPDKTPIIQANKNEFLVWGTEKNIFYPKENLPAGKYIWYIWENDIPKNISYTPYTDNSHQLFYFFGSLSPKKWLSPIYIKTPHITCPKK